MKSQCEHSDTGLCKTCFDYEQTISTKDTEHEKVVSDLKDEIERLDKIANQRTATPSEYERHKIWKEAHDQYKFDLEMKTNDLKSKLKVAEEALESARPSIKRLWDDTKGTEREGSAMGASHSLKAIDSALKQIRESRDE